MTLNIRYDLPHLFWRVTIFYPGPAHFQIERSVPLGLGKILLFN
jgi:hypothetical protein